MSLPSLPTLKKVIGEFILWSPKAGISFGSATGVVAFDVRWLGEIDIP